MSSTGLPTKFYDMKIFKPYCDNPTTEDHTDAGYFHSALFTETFTDGESSAEPCKMCCDCMSSAAGKFHDMDESIGFFKYLILTSKEMHFLFAQMLYTLHITRYTLTIMHTHYTVTHLSL